MKATTAAKPVSPCMVEDRGVPGNMEAVHVLARKIGLPERVCATYPLTDWECRMVAAFSRFTYEQVRAACPQCRKAR